MAVVQVVNLGLSWILSADSRIPRSGKPTVRPPCPQVAYFPSGVPRSATRWYTARAR
jgi:hypothetical protein